MAPDKSISLLGFRTARCVLPEVTADRTLDISTYTLPMNLDEAGLVRFTGRRMGLLELPAELRLYIYELVFAPAGCICLCQELNCAAVYMESEQSCPWSCALRNSHKSLCHEHLSVGLLRTCRQIHEEAPDMIFENSTFMFSLPEAFSTGHDDGIKSDSKEAESTLIATKSIIPKMRYVFVVYDLDRSEKDDTISKVFRNMELLERLRITVLIPQVPGLGLSISATSSLLHAHGNALKAILNSVPRSCEVSFGSNTPAEKSFVAIKRMAEYRCPQNYRGDLAVVKEDFFRTSRQKATVQR